MIELRDVRFSWSGREPLLAEHADKSLTVVGVIAPTGTPIDRTVDVSLAAIQAIHLDWQSGIPAPKSQRVSAEDARQHDLTADSVSAILIGRDARRSDSGLASLSALARRWLDHPTVEATT